MIAELGRFLIALALTATLAQIVLAWLGANRGGQGGLARAGEAAVRIAVFAAASAFLLLIVSFLRSDFSIAYVAGHSHVDKPLVYKIAAAWGGHEGSMLLWCLLLALFGFAISRIGPVDDALRLRAVSVQGMLQLLFFGFLAFASNPFDRAIPAPIQGADLNPILQDPALHIPVQNQTDELVLRFPPGNHGRVNAGRQIVHGVDAQFHLVDEGGHVDTALGLEIDRARPFAGRRRDFLDPVEVGHRLLDPHEDLFLNVLRGRARPGHGDRHAVPGN